MKKYLYILACLVCLLTLASCSGDIHTTKYKGQETIDAVASSQLSKEEKEQFQFAIDILDDYKLQGKTVKDIIASGKAEVEKQEKEKQKLEQLIKEVSEELKTGIMEDGVHKVGLGKKIEDAWKANMDNIELAALYEYYHTLFYINIEKKDDALAAIRKISPYYDGVLSEEIQKIGLELFGSIQKWEEEHQIGVEVIERERNRLNGDLSFEVSVYNWVHKRYEYYDAKEGKDSGDKYSDIIFQEAADEFHITVQEVDAIMFDINVITKAGQQNNTSGSTNKKNDDIPNDAISLYYKGAEILCATTTDNYGSIINFIVKQDEVRFNQMFANGTAFSVPSNTKALVLERKLTMSKVRICEGIYKDEIAWVASEAIP